MPTWATIVICLAVLVAIKVFELKRNSKLEAQGKIKSRKSGFMKNAEIFTLRAVEPDRVTEGLREMLSQKQITGLTEDPEKQCYAIEGRLLSRWTAQLRRIHADAETCAYRFEFTGWQERYGKAEEEESMNAALTAVEKLFFLLDPNTQITSEPVRYHSN